MGMSSQNSTVMTADATAQRDAGALAEKIPDLVNGNPALQLRGRYATFAMMLEIGAVPYYISVVDGRVAQMDRGPLIMRSWSVAIRGAESAWLTFWQPLPPPHFHDIFALAKRGDFRIEGDMRPLLTHLLFIKDMLAAPRTLAEGNAR
jgi:hypothetical protein